MRRIKKSLILMMAISALVYSALILTGDISKIRSVRIEPILLIPTFIFASMNYTLRMVRFEYYLRVEGIKIDAAGRRLVFFSGLLFTVTPGKMGELMKNYILKKKYGARMSRTLPIVINERINDVISVLLICAVTSPFFFGSFLPALFCIAMAAGVVAAVRVRKLFTMIIGVAGRFGPLRKRADDLSSMYEGIYRLNGGRPLAIATALGFLAWSVEASVLWLTLRSMGADASLMGTIFIYIISSVIGIISAIPGGLGVTEGGIFLLLQGIGISSALAGTATIITRFSTLWFAVALGAVAFWRVGGFRLGRMQPAAHEGSAAGRKQE